MNAQTKIDRRAFIAGMGASLVLASMPSRDGYALAADATSADGGDPAYEPWESWRGEPADGPLALVRAAIVAANAHNTQPWFFRVQPSRIEVMSDTSRNIGTVDPLLREMHIGIGCALENLMLAAAAHGYACKLTLNENDPALAVAELTPSGDREAGAVRRDRQPAYESRRLRHDAGSRCGRHERIAATGRRRQGQGHLVFSAGRPCAIRRPNHSGDGGVRGGPGSIAR